MASAGGYWTLDDDGNSGWQPGAFEPAAAGAAAGNSALSPQLHAPAGQALLATQPQPPEGQAVAATDKLLGYAQNKGEPTPQ